MGSLGSSSKIYLDTSVYIYFFEGHSKFSSSVEEILVECTKKQITIIASTLLTTELLVAPLKIGNDELVEKYSNLAGYLPNMHYVSFSLNISVKAAEFRAKYNMATPDAIHLATAVDSKVDMFFTGDKKLAKIGKVSDTKVATLS